MMQGKDKAVETTCNLPSCVVQLVAFGLSNSLIQRHANIKAALAASRFAPATASAARLSFL